MQTGERLDLSTGCCVAILEGRFSVNLNPSLEEERGQRRAISQSSTEWSQTGNLFPPELSEAELRQCESVIGRRYRVRAGRFLCHSNDRFVNLYVIQFGEFKSRKIDVNGAEHIINLDMIGDVLGMDAIDSQLYQCDCIALDDSEVWAVPFSQFELLFAKISGLSHHFQRLMSRHITRDQSWMFVLGRTNAEQRLAAFLVSLSARYLASGYSGTRFHLRMSRTDIGNHLALRLETVSRLLNRFCQRKWLTVDGREVEIIHPIALQRLAAGQKELKSVGHT
jgi:CRP/FNR family transcriptional regulator